MTTLGRPLDATTPSALRDKYAIIGVGETPFVRGIDRTTRALAATAIRNAMADAGIAPDEVDGLLSYSLGDSTFSPLVAADLGLRLNFFMDVFGGGSSTEALIGIAIGVIEAGLCRSVVVFRAMHGFTGVRMGGTGRAGGAISGDALHAAVYGWFSPAQRFSPAFMRHMHDFGTTPEQVAMVKVFQSEHASNNPKAIYRRRLLVDDILNSRFIVKPVHLLDCCVETDNATALIITSADRAYDYRHTPARILGVVGRCSAPRADMPYQFGPISSWAGRYAREILWRNAGLGPEDIDVTGAYDAFTFTCMLALEDFGFCAKGEGGDYVSSGVTRLGAGRPNNTSGGQLCEGYTHGMNLVIENVRQLRGEIDDSCPIGSQGEHRHTFDYREGGCRQVPNVGVTANLGWAGPQTGSGLVLRKG